MSDIKTFSQAVPILAEHGMEPKAIGGRLWSVGSMTYDKAGVVRLARELQTRGPALSSKMQAIARDYLDARKRSGSALLDAVRFLAEARAAAKHGEWEIFLAAIGLDESRARAQIRIHEEAERDHVFAERVRSGFLTEAVARELLPASPEVRAEVLARDDPPTLQEVRTAKRASTPAMEATPFWQAISPAHPTAHLWTISERGAYLSACGIHTGAGGVTGSTEAGHCSSCVRATWKQASDPEVEAFSKRTPEDLLSAGLEARRRAADEQMKRSFPPELLAEAEALGIKLTSYDGGKLAFFDLPDGRSPRGNAKALEQVIAEWKKRSTSTMVCASCGGESGVDLASPQWSTLPDRTKVSNIGARVEADGTFYCSQCAPKRAAAAPPDLPSDAGAEILEAPPEVATAAAQRLRCPTCGDEILNGIWGGLKECGTCYQARQRIPHLATKYGLRMLWEGNGVKLFWEEERDQLGQMEALPPTLMLEWLENDAPGKAEGRVDAALAKLDDELPKDLQNAGYFWKAPFPPTIAHNVGNWQADAPTVGAALQLARDHLRAKAEADPRRKATELLRQLTPLLLAITPASDAETLSMAISDLNECEEGSEAEHWLAVGWAIIGGVE